MNVNELINNKIYPDNEYMPLKDMQDKAIRVTDVTLFTNEKGAGVGFLFKFEGDDKEYKCVTHAIQITAILSNGLVKDVLDKGDTINGTIVYKTSKNGRQMYVFTD